MNDLPESVTEGDLRLLVDDVGHMFSGDSRMDVRQTAQTGLWLLNAGVIQINQGRTTILQFQYRRQIDSSPLLYSDKKIKHFKYKNLLNIWASTSLKT